MDRRIKAVVTARNERHDLNFTAEMECTEAELDDVRRERIEAMLRGMVMVASDNAGVDFETAGVIWRERGNRHRWNFEDTGTREPASRVTGCNVNDE